MQRLLTTLWPSAIDGRLTIHHLPSQHSNHFDIQTAVTISGDEWAELQQGAYANDDVYFGLGARGADVQRGKQGGKKDVVALPGFALDVDFLDPPCPQCEKPAHRCDCGKTKPAHASDNLPPGEAEVYEILKVGHEPTIVVSTGNGWHLYWCFNEYLQTESLSQKTQVQKAYKDFQSIYIEQAKKLGYHIDYTHAIQRIWRVPGTINKKNNKPVEIIHIEPKNRYTVQELVKAPSARVVVKETKNLKVITQALKALSPDNPNADLVDKVLRGLSFAERGGRDEALQKVCSTIVFVRELRKFPPETLLEVLIPSLTAWSLEPDAQKSLEEEKEKALDKLIRAKQDLEARKAQFEEKIAGLKNKFTSNKDPQKVEEAVEEWVLKRTIIQKAASYWIYNFNTDKYAGPKIKDEIIPYARDAWQDGPDNLELTYVNSKHEIISKKLPRILNDYCQVVEKVIGSLAINDSYVDLDQNVFFEALAPIRKFKPRFDPDIDAWLKLLAGPAYEKVCDWLAAVTRLDKQCCALYLAGASGAGKGMLADGIAKLWHDGGPTKLKDVLGNYNADMFSCPFIFLDEGLSKNTTGVSTALRSLLGSESFTVTQKYAINRPVIGSVRLLIGANNDDVLSFGDERMSLEDLKAVVGRFLYVKVSHEATAWMEENNKNRELTDRWVGQYLLARHILWLRENRDLSHGKRFLVEGDETENIHRRFLMQGEITGSIFEWLVRFSSNPQPLISSYRAKNKRPLALIGDGCLFINNQGMVDGWTMYMPQEVKRPSTTRIGETLKKLSQRVLRKGPRDDRVRYHDIRSDLLLAWAAENHIGNEDAIENNLKSELEEDDR